MAREVTLEEFTDFVEGVAAREGVAFDARITPEEIERTFKFIDDDNSNTIDRDEFEQYMAMFDEKDINLLDL